jgi:enediyne biosynthesis protein E4
MRRRRLALGLAVAGALVPAGWLGFEVRDFQSNLERARREVDRGQHGAARLRLARLSARRPRRAEVEYLLGICEQAEGHPEAALSAWSRIPPGSPFAAKAVVPGARALLAGRGAFTEAEEVLRAALAGRNPRAEEARWLLAELLLWEGRLDEVRRLLEDGWGRAADRFALLREHWRLDTVIVAREEIQAMLDQAARASPDDDRVWLARAYLDVRYGRFDKARRRLRDCLAKRPADPVVWRAWLSWNLASGRVDDLDAALAHLSAERVATEQILALRVWLFARAGDSNAERRELERLVQWAPADTRALDRLAALAAEAGDAPRAAELRRRQAEADRAKERYRRLLMGRRAKAPVADLHELARLAETLGRAFEARGWWQLALSQDPTDLVARSSLGRLNRRPREQPPLPAATLKDQLADIDLSSLRPAPTPTPEQFAATPRFEDDAAAAGLRFRFDNGQSRLRQIPETMGGGMAVLDYDGDGWLDAYCVQGGPFPPRPDRDPPGDRLFRNRGDGTFEDVTARSRIGGMARGYGHGVSVGDVDNDGHPDLFLTRWRGYALYRNRGDGTFEDVTAAAGLGGDRDWPTSAAFADLDNDGDLDLYVCHYLAWDAEHPALCRNEQYTKGYVSCLPLQFEAMPDHVFRNDGGRFVDVTAEAGIVDRDGRGLGVVAADLDDDGRVDLYVANDMTANLLFLNRGGWRFEEAGFAAGVACGADGVARAGMGVACGDLDGDGAPDLAVTNFYGESTSFYRNLGRGLFADQTEAIGLAAPSRFLLGFGVAFLDADNDGRLDLAAANGHVNDLRPKLPYAMPSQLLLGGPGGRLRDLTDAAGPPWGVPRVGRGLAAGDLDNDGRVDLLIVAQDRPLAFFHNRSGGDGHFVTFRLAGTASNRDGVGARVAVTAGGRRRAALRCGGGSYQSASDPRLHFGLGPCERVESVEVRWPSGLVDRHRDLPADAGYLLREGAATAEPLAGFDHARARNRGDSHRAGP